MASHTTKKRSYKKRTSKKIKQSGGMKDNALCNLLCKDDPKSADGSPEVNKDEDDDNEDEVEKEERTEVEKEESTEEESEDDDNKDEVEEDDTIIGFGKKGRKSKKTTKKGRKSSNKKRKTMKKKGKSAWTTFVVELYRKNKQKNPVYMFKTALKDAAKIYKK